MPKATKVLESCLYADDLEAAKGFYQKVFGLELFSEAPGRHLFFRCRAGVTASMCATRQGIVWK